jgi:hypothetical protein
VQEIRGSRELGACCQHTALAAIASSSVVMYSRNIPAIQIRLDFISVVAVEVLRRVSLASMLPTSIMAEERIWLRSCRGPLGVSMRYTFGGRDALYSL